MNIKLGKAIETQINMIINELLEFKKEFPNVYIDFTLHNTLNNLIHNISLTVFIGKQIYDYHLIYSPTGKSINLLQVNFINYPESAETGIYYIWERIKANFNNRMNMQLLEVV